MNDVLQVGCRSIPIKVHCPFCAGDGQIVYFPAHELPIGETPYYQGECKVCGARTKRCYTITAAVNAWIRRPEYVATSAETID